MRQTKPDSVSAALVEHLREAIARAGGWIPFDQFMDLALYEPGLGYYARQARLFGQMPQSGSDFVTAPELSPFFGRTLAAQVARSPHGATPCRVKRCTSVASPGSAGSSMRGHSLNTRLRAA